MYFSFLTSKMEEVFNCVDVLQAQPLDAGLERAEAAPPSSAAKELLEEPKEGERAARDEAEDGQQGEGVDHGRAALVVVGRDGVAATVAARCGLVTVGDGGRSRGSLTAPPHEPEGRENVLVPPKPPVRVSGHVESLNK